MVLISVIMPNYNGSKYLSQAIESVINQSFVELELIIVDDCSTDDSVNILQSYALKDPRIFLYLNDTNRGVAYSRNRGISLSTGRYIAFLDSDDFWLPHKLSTQLKIFEKFNCKITYSAYEVVNGSNNILGKVVPPLRLNYSDLLKSNYIGNLTGMFDAFALGKPIILNVGHEDYVLWLNLLKRTDYAYGTQEVLAKYRKLEKSVSSNKIKTIKWQWKIYRDIQNLNLFKSLYLMIHYAFNGVFKLKRL
jgi:teichuronic acid biosynthesis glycosyltransferase TuaG